MYINDCTTKIGNKTYRRVLLVEGYRDEGKVKHKTIANLSKCSDIEIEAIKIALKNKNNIVYLEKLANGKSINGKIFGCVLALFQIAKDIGLFNILKPLGKEIAKLIMWLVFARLINQGSRLSAVRLADIHPGCEVLEIPKLNENILYSAMNNLFKNKEMIEKNIFNEWSKKHPEGKENQIFLYDVSSSYFEGTENELAFHGYNRDKKSGKKQIVYGLLTDVEGEPLGIEAFNGNTNDTKTFAAQIDKVKNKYNCRFVTLIGDKGMIKTAQIENMTEESIDYITSITKSQIETLINEKTIEMELFDDKLCEMDGEIDVNINNKKNGSFVFSVNNLKENQNIDIFIRQLNNDFKTRIPENQQTEDEKRASITNFIKSDKYIQLITEYIEKQNGNDEKLIKNITDLINEHKDITSQSEEIYYNRLDILTAIYPNILRKNQKIKQKVRYIFRRNPERADLIRKNRQNKIDKIKNKVNDSNKYLEEHKKAKTATQITRINLLIKKLDFDDCIAVVNNTGRAIELEISNDKLKEKSKLDGCYCIKTNLSKEAGDKEFVHDKYKSLIEVERAFRNQKSELEVRPIFLRNKGRTISHLLITMLAYKIERYLQNAWKDQNITVHEGLEALSMIGSTILEIGNSKMIKIQNPNPQCKTLLEKINVKIPDYFPHKEVIVATNKKLDINRIS